MWGGVSRRDIWQIQKSAAALVLILEIEAASTRLESDIEDY